MKLQFIKLAKLRRMVGMALLVVASAGLAQQSAGSTGEHDGGGPVIDWSAQKTAVIRQFIAPAPAEYMKAIDDEREVVRARIVLDASTTVELSERPRDIDYYDSTIQVERKGHPVRRYKVGELMKHQALKLAHVALVPTSDASGMLVFEYEGGAVGAREGFAVLRYSPSGLEVRVLPLTDFGKVVVFRGRPELAEIWSALADNVGSDADPRAYETRVCQWQPNGYLCGAPKRQRRKFAPGAIDDPGIEIRP
jgi:hypothetical protein